MVMAENRHTSLVRMGKWNVPSKEQREIQALITKLEKITNKNKNEQGKNKRNKRFEWTKVAPKDGVNTKEKNGKIALSHPQPNF